VTAAERSSFFGRRGMVLRVILGYHEMHIQCEALAKSGGQIHQLYYEDLVRDPSSQMKAVCEFLQIPFDPKMTQLKGADRSAIDDLGHHSLVKGERIVAGEKRSLSLPAALEQKIERYIHLWRQQSKGVWPVYSRSLADEVQNPSMWERSRDRVTYVVTRSWRHSAPVVFSMVPTRVWAIYRKFIEARRLARLRHRGAIS